MSSSASLFLLAPNTLQYMTGSFSLWYKEVAITSSFVAWSRHEMPRILRSQRRWKTSSLWVIIVVLFHVSHAKIALGITMDVYRRNFTQKLMVVDYHNDRTKPLENWCSFSDPEVLHPAQSRRCLTCFFQYMETSRRNPRSVAFWWWEDDVQVRSLWLWSSRCSS